MQNTYEFQGQPLTPKRAEKLIMEHFKEGEYKLQDITRQVNRLHLDSGGCECASDSYNPVASALQKLTKKGSIERLKRKRGLYRILSHPSPSPDPDGPKTIGEGDGCVYIYYFPAYRRLAEYENNSSWPCKIWPCKIGHTVQYNPRHRIIIQVGTPMPEEPEIGLIIKTDNPSDIEQRIHSILKEFNTHIENAPGKEWFLTNPDQVARIYNNL